MDVAGLVAPGVVAKDEQRLTRFRLLPVTEDVAEEFAAIVEHKKLKKVGRPDLLIACIALAHDATLVTRNVKDFANVPGLKVENWAA